ncbi:hypothetical protein HF290_12945 [Acidithiobacillus ferrooxidans]|uniref:hypothetical protein n=1 Tax=Acidithiobacillus ferrooxidans TaxID=920 RepID=UPI001C07366B|nr:hypothetical protein [Acidithiobacillus ferrooxidans]MBU2861270.1 hypothetical protein [Acidithiobacillus ferrooxidans]
MNSKTIQLIFILVELMDITAITTNPATVAIRQYFFSIKIASAPSVAGHFRIAANSGRACNTYITDGGLIAI